MNQSKNQHIVPVNISRFWNQNSSLLCRLVYQPNIKKKKVIKHCKDIHDLYYSIRAIYSELKKSATCDPHEFADCLMDLDLLYVLLIKDETKNIWWGWSQVEVIDQTIGYYIKENEANTDEPLDIQTEKKKCQALNTSNNLIRSNSQQILPDNRVEIYQDQDDINSKIKPQQSQESKEWIQQKNELQYQQKSSIEIEKKKKIKNKPKDKRQSQKIFRDLRVRNQKLDYYEPRVRKYRKKNYVSM